MSETVFFISLYYLVTFLICILYEYVVEKLGTVFFVESEIT